MKSAYAVTRNSHNCRAAVHELANGVKEGTALLKNSCAILLARAIFNPDEFSPALFKELAKQILPPALNYVGFCSHGKFFPASIQKNCAQCFPQHFIYGLKALNPVSRVYLYVR